MTNIINLMILKVCVQRNDFNPENTGPVPKVYLGLIIQQNILLTTNSSR